MARTAVAPQASSRQLGVWIAGALAVLAVLLVAGTASPIRRALDIPPGRAGLMSLWDRGGYGPIALRMTREYPLTGVGAGSYRVLAPDYHRAMANDALPLDNAQNWWRHQIAELGVFGGALVIAFSVLVAWRVLTGREAVRDVAAASTVRGLLLGLGVVSLLGMPTQNPLVLYWFFALVAWFATLVPDSDATRETTGGDAHGLDRGRRAWPWRTQPDICCSPPGSLNVVPARAAGAPRLRHRRVSA